MVDLVYCTTDLLFLDIPLLYYYLNLNLSTIGRLSSEDINLSFGVSVSLLTALKYFGQIFL